MSIRPLKRLGQNFLRDPNTAAKIATAACPNPDLTVVEIGPGDGALTKHLLDRTDKLSVIEVDSRAVEVLRDRFPKLDIIHDDVLRVDWQALSEERGSKLVVVGNLPYNITSPILFRLLAASSVISEIVVMVQLEVAQRIVAHPRTKAYGSLSVGVQLQTAPTLLFKVSRNVFYPKPKVTSAVVRLAVADGLLQQSELDQVRVLVRTAFNQRRKTLRNSIRKLLPVPEPEKEQENVQLEYFRENYGARRAEELTPQEFVDLARTLEMI